jgi:hypothetical protein
MRYHLRTLLVLLAVGPPLLWAGWSSFEDAKELAALEAAIEQYKCGHGDYPAAGTGACGSR